MAFKIINAAALILAVSQALNLKENIDTDITEKANVAAHELETEERRRNRNRNNNRVVHVNHRAPARRVVHVNHRAPAVTRVIHHNSAPVTKVVHINTGFSSDGSCWKRTS